MITRKLQQIHQWAITREGRERQLLWALLFLFTWTVWYWLPGKAAHNHLAAKKQQLADLEQQIHAVSKESATILQIMASPQFREYKKSQKNLQAERARLINGIETLAKNAIPAEKLPVMVTEVLAAQTGSLIPGKLQMLPSEPWIPQNGHHQSLPANTRGVRKYPVMITFRGRYPETASYLEHLASLSWGLKWDSLNYEVTAWPQAEVNLIFHVLGRPEKEQP